MDPTNSGEHQRNAIDAEIQALKRRRNTLAPISSLPTEVTTTIFFFFRVPVPSSSDSLFTRVQKPESDSLAWLRIAHVCHHWREIVLNQPLFWSHVNFNSFSSVGMAEILSRAKSAPLHLRANVTYDCQWDDARFSAFQKELHSRVSRIRHLSISVDYVRLRDALEGLVSLAPTLEYLSLSRWDYPNMLETGQRGFVPDTLFAVAAPKLSYLELWYCDISWKSSLLIGLRYLLIHSPSANARPSLSVWLDALEKMPQLETLTLHSASPIASGDFALQSDVKRTVTLPSLAKLEMSASVRDCGLALAHLALPALTLLSLTARSLHVENSDVQEILPCVVRGHTYNSYATACRMGCFPPIPSQVRGHADVRLVLAMVVSGRGEKGTDEIMDMGSG